MPLAQFASFARGWEAGLGQSVCGGAAFLPQDTEQSSVVLLSPAQHSSSPLLCLFIDPQPGRKLKVMKELCRDREVCAAQVSAVPTGQGLGLLESDAP